MYWKWGSNMKPKRSHLGLEQLESRDAPATLVSATKLTYQDVDGDNVTVTLSKPLLNQGNVNSVFLFDTGTVEGFNSTKQQLRTIKLTGFGAAAAGTSITTVATRGPLTGGDGFAALGQVDATGIDLGGVTIDGDLGRVLAGDATTSTSGLTGLTVHSLGRFGTSTGAPDLRTVIQGKLGFLKIKSDVREASVSVEGAADGRLGSVSIGGSLIGGGGNFSGRIISEGAMGVVRVRGDVLGGGGSESAEIRSGDFGDTTRGTLAGVTIGGSLLGGAGNLSGRIESNGAMGAVKIAGKVQGGGGSESA